MERKAILLVDDELYVLESIKNELEDSFGNEYYIEVAENGNEAIKLFDDLKKIGFTIPLVISDYIMPDIKGDEVLTKIKEMDNSTYTIMLTGQATLEGVTNSINQARLYRYISKPWENSDLILTVKEALKGYFKDKELEMRRIELEIANEKLTKLDSAKTYFLGLLSHELNTPLMGINANAKFIMELSSDDDLIECADEILESEASLRKFAELSLLITRIQADKYDTKFASERLNDLFESVFFKFKEKLDEKAINLKISLPEKSVYIKADFSLIMKVIEIIFDNAIKFSPNKSEINITSYLNNKYCEIQIIDNGPGFSENYLNNAFDLFNSTDNLMEHSKGSGLSLATANVIMEMHKFKLELSNAKDKGAIVKMIFYDYLVED